MKLKGYQTLPPEQKLVDSVTPIPSVTVQYMQPKCAEKGDPEPNRVKEEGMGMNECGLGMCWLCYG